MCSLNCFDAYSCVAIHTAIILLFALKLLTALITSNVLIEYKKKKLRDQTVAKIIWVTWVTRGSKYKTKIFSVLKVN